MSSQTPRDNPDVRLLSMHLGCGGSQLNKSSASKNNEPPSPDDLRSVLTPAPLPHTNPPSKLCNYARSQWNPLLKSTASGLTLIHARFPASVSPRDAIFVPSNHRRRRFPRSKSRHSEVSVEATLNGPKPRPPPLGRSQPLAFVLMHLGCAGQQLTGVSSSTVSGVRWWMVASGVVWWWWCGGVVVW